MKNCFHKCKWHNHMYNNSSWNREGSGAGQEEDDDNSQPINQERNNLSQGQYHFFSMTGMIFIIQRF